MNLLYIFCDLFCDNPPSGITTGDVENNSICACHSFRGQPTSVSHPKPTVVLDDNIDICYPVLVGFGIVRLLIVNFQCSDFV